MDYKELYKRAFSTVRETYPCSDHEKALKNVMERANTMTKKEENVRQVKFTEIPVTYTEPKKSTMVFHAVAGVAGAAAVLTGAVFGLKFLNEHGGLKERTDITTGAAYNDMVKSEYPEYTMPHEIIPENIEFHFNGLTVKPMEYVYDGLTLQMTYKMTYPDAVPEDFENDITLRMFDGNSIHSAEKLSVISKNGNTATLVWSQTGVEVKQSREVRFIPTKEELMPIETAAQEALGSCAVTVNLPDDSPIYTLEPKMLTYIFDEDEIHRIKKVNICKFTAEIVVDSPEPVPDNYIKDIKIIMKDGTELHPTNDQKTLDAFGMNDKNEHYYAYSLPGIAPDTVDKVYINNIEITDKAAHDSEPKDILQSVGDVLEFDGLTATIEKVDFDGTFLRVYYTPSGYKGENKEGSRRFQSAMMTLGTPETEAYDPRRVCSYVGAYDEESGLNCTAMFVDLDEGDTLDINFRYSEETGHYTLTGIGKSENTCVYDINNNGLRWIRLSPSGVVIASSEKYYTHDPQCSFSVICKDGSSRRLYDDSIMYGGAANECSGGLIEEHFGLESGDIVTTFLSIDPDPIDVRNIVAVEINGTVIPLSTE